MMSGESIFELRATITGRVQGVRFRKTVQTFAAEHGITGFVRNLPDGSVELCAQGTRPQLEYLLAWLKKSPGFSKVAAVRETWADATAHREEFTIEREGGIIHDQLQSMRNLGKSIAANAQPPSIPRHVAIIPDGNRRWAKRRGMVPTAGHAQSTEHDRVLALLGEARALGITYLTIWGFSTENWKRSEEERNEIFRLVRKVLEEFRATASENKIRFRCFGRRDRLDPSLVEQIAALERETAKHSGVHFSLCLDYGGRDEILRAVKAAMERGAEITEQNVQEHLDTGGIPDPDLIIRTGGEQRLSGFLPWQSIYAELYFTELFFPDFGPAELRAAVEEYSSRARRFGA